MKIKELIKELRQFPADAEVYMVSDWEALDDEGHLNDLRRLTGLSDQHIYVNDGLDWTDVTEVLLEFDTDRA